MLNKFQRPLNLHQFELTNGDRSVLLLLRPNKNKSCQRKLTQKHNYLQCAQITTQVQSQGVMKEDFLEKGYSFLKIFPRLLFFNNLMFLRCGHVVRDFESEAKTKCNFQFR